MANNEISLGVELDSKEAIQGLEGIYDGLEDLIKIAKQDMQINFDIDQGLDGLKRAKAALDKLQDESNQKIQLLIETAKSEDEIKQLEQEYKRFESLTLKGLEVDFKINNAPIQELTGIPKMVQSAFAGIPSIIQNFLNPFNLIPGIFNTITSSVGILGSAFNGLVSGLSTVGSLVSSAIMIPFQALSALFSTVTGVISSVISGFTELVFFVGNLGQAFDTLVRFAQPVINFFTGIYDSLYNAIQVTADFEKQISNVASVTGASAADMKLLSDAALKVGADTSLSASQAAEALYALGSAGLSTKDAISALEGTAKLSEATQSSLAASTELVVSSIAQYKMQASDATKISNIFAAGINVSQLNMDRLGLSLKYVGPVAGSLGISLESTVATLGALSNAGIMGETAGTALRNAMTELLNPSTAASNVLNTLGINTQNMSKLFTDSVSNGINPFSAAVDLLKSKNITTAQTMQLFGDAAGPAMVALLNQGSKAINDMQTKVTGTQAAFDAAKIQLDNYRGATLQLSGSIETLQILIGGVFQKSLTAITNVIINVVNGLTNFLTATGLLSSAQTVLNSITQALLNSLGLLSPILTVIISTFTALGTILSTTTNAIITTIAQNDLFKTTFDNISAAVSASSTVLAAFISRVLGLNPSVLEAKTNLKDLKEAVNNYITQLAASKAAQDLFKSAADAINLILKTLSTSLTSVTAAVMSFIGSFKLDSIKSTSDILNVLSLSVQQFSKYLTTSITSITAWAVEFIKSGQAFETVKTIFNTGINIFQGIINVIIQIPAVISAILPSLSQLATGLSAAFVALTKGDINGAIEKTFSALTQVLANFIGSITGNKQAIINAFSEIFTGLSNSFTNIKEKILVPMLNDFTNSLTTGLVKSLEDTAKKVTENIKIIGTSITAGLTTVFSGMKSIGQLLQESLSKGGETSTLFSPVVESIKQGMEIIKVTITQGIPALGSMISPLFKDLIKGIAQVIDFLPVNDKIKKGMTDILYTLKTGMETGKVTEAFKGLKDPIIVVFKEIIAEVKKILSDDLKAGIKQGFDVAIAGGIAAIGLWAASLTPAVTTAFATVGTSIAASIALWPAAFAIGIAALTVAVAAYLKAEGLNWASYVITALGVAAAAITAGIVGWPVVALAAIAGLGSAIYDYLIGHSLIDDIPMWFGQVFQATATYFTTVGSMLSAPFMAIWDFIKNSVDTITGYATEIGDGVISTISEIFNSGASIISDAFTSIWDFMSTNITTIIALATDIGNSIINTIVDLISSGKETIINAFTAIWDSLRGAVDTVIEIGKDIGQGLIDSISGAIESGKAIIEGTINTIIGIAQGAYDKVMSIVNAAKQVASAPINVVAGVAAAVGEASVDLGLATGGIVQASRGGSVVRMAEAGMNEAAVPLPDGRSIPVSFNNLPDFSNLANNQGNTVNITFGNVSINNEIDQKEFFRKVEASVSEALVRKTGRR